MRRRWTFASAMLGMVSVAFADPAPIEPSSFSTNAQFSVDSGAVSLASAAVATIEARNFAPGYSWLRIYFYSGPLSKEEIAGAMNGKVNSRWNAVIQLTVDKDLKITQVDMSIPGHGCTIASFEQEVRAFPQEYRFDGHLQRLVELGLDRFGDNVLNSNGSRRSAVILFRFNDFDAKMRNLQKQCVADAWKEWCVAPTSGGTCPSEQPPAALQLQSFAVRSTEKLLRPDGGGAQYWQFTYTGAQRQAEPLELLGKVVVHFAGTIMLTYRLEGKP